MSCLELVVSGLLDVVLVCFGIVGVVELCV